MEKHKMAGKPIKVVSGRFKGLIFTPIDYVVNQFQGKRISKIIKGHSNLFVGVPEDERDDQLVIGELYGLHKDDNRRVLHDKHLKKEVADATTGSSEENNRNDDAGRPELDGCGVSSGEVHDENVLPLKRQEEPSGLTGSGSVGPAPEHSRPSDSEGGTSDGASDPQGSPSRGTPDSEDHS